MFQVTCFSFIKVAVRAEILPRDLPQTLGNYYLSSTIVKIQTLKYFTVNKFHPFLKALTMKNQLSRIKGLPTQTF